MSEYLGLHFLLIVCAFSGLSLAAFIHFKKKLSVPLLCPIGHSCDPVVHSDYSRFFGIPVELLGMLYYFLIFLFYSLFLLFPELETGTIAFTFVGISSLAFLFSVYLTAVQAFILREWCTWCLISATLCAVIFFVGLKLSNVNWSLVLSVLLTAIS